MCQCDVSGDTQADPGTAAFGGEEGHEDAFMLAGWQPCAIVADGNHYMLARGRTNDSHGSFTHVRNRFYGILQQIDDGLFQQLRVCSQAWHGTADARFEGKIGRASWRERG